MRDLRQQGHSLEQISQACVVPIVGKNKKKRKQSMITGMAKKLAQSQNKKHKADATAAVEDEKVSRISIEIVKPSIRKKKLFSATLSQHIRMSIR